jgi:hypothetical protein
VRGRRGAQVLNGPVFKLAHRSSIGCGGVSERPVLRLRRLVRAEWRAVTCKTLVSVGHGRISSPISRHPAKPNKRPPRPIHVLPPTFLLPGAEGGHTAS